MVLTGLDTKCCLFPRHQHHCQHRQCCPDAAAQTLLSPISALRSLGWSLEVVASNELAHGDDAVQARKPWGVTVHRPPVVSSVEEVLRRKRSMFDPVYPHRLPNAEGYAALGSGTGHIAPARVG